MDTMEQVREAFKELRKSDFIAYMSFEDCSSCAGASLYDMAQKKGKGKIVYFHTQDKSAYEYSGELSIRFGMIFPDGVADEHEQFRLLAIGLEICSVLVAHRLKVRWDSNPGRVIEVLGVERDKTPMWSDPKFMKDMFNYLGPLGYTKINLGISLMKFNDTHGEERVEAMARYIKWAEENHRSIAEITETLAHDIAGCEDKTMFPRTANY